MDPYDFTKLREYSSIPEDGYPKASWNNQDGGSQGFGFFYQPPPKKKNHINGDMKRLPHSKKISFQYRSQGASSEVKSSATTPSDSSFLWSTEEFLQKMERLGEIVEQACARLIHNHLLPIVEKGKEVEEAIRKDVEEEMSIKKEEDLERSQVVERIEEKRREVEEANGAHDEDDIVVDEVSTSYK
ncbi:unnamed protein product [Linum trigynum]|uniref:Uncharacterized protein n=1 Tax=Linum trigynum TaxID=586398 RepID=A0AAV2E8H7_9ROSI